jgi:branched-chain amino acid transport system permease protein
MPLLATETGQFNTSYAQEVRVHQTRHKQLLMIALLAVVFLGAPAMLSEYWLGVVNLIGVVAVGALGLNILVGYTGLISLGHAAFAAVGAYAMGNLLLRTGVPLWATIPLSGLVAGTFSLIFGLAALRIKGLYLAIATLAAQSIVTWIIVRWDWVGGGNQGVIVVPPAKIGPIDTATVTGKFYLIAGIVLLTMFFMENLFRTRVGRALIAVRDQDLAAAGMGVPIFQTKMLAFFVSSFFAGVAGALFAINLGVVTNETFNLDLSIQFLAIILIGGLGSVPGAILGAAFVTLLPIVLRDNIVPAMGMSLGPSLEVYVVLAAYGASILLFLILEPRGLYGLYRNIRDYFRMWPFSY